MGLKSPVASVRLTKSVVSSGIVGRIMEILSLAEIRR